MRGKMDCYGATTIGRHRESNQDQFLIADLSRSMQVHQTSLDFDNQTRLFGGTQGSLLLVADGMGGHAAGDVASRIAVDSLTSYVLNTMHWFLRLDPGCESDFLDGLKSALEHCQSNILADMAHTPERHGMGTTLTMAYVTWPRLYVVHAGDSRCYLYRNGSLQQITTDHTMAQRFIEQGDLPRAEAEASRWSHVLWKVVGGTAEEVNAEVYKAELELGDTLLLCSDGLHGQLPEKQIAEVLHRDATAAATCTELLAAADGAGGVDNTTVVVARFRDRETTHSLAASESTSDTAEFPRLELPNASENAAIEQGTA